jgi:hypothetical protein
VDIANIKTLVEGKRFGHSFDAVFKMKYVPAPDASKAGDCQLVWREWSNRVPDWYTRTHGIVDRMWHDTFYLFGGDGFDGWNNKKIPPCGGELTVTEPDSPATNIGRFERTVYFALSIRSTPGCPCDYQDGGYAYATQNLDNDGNKITKQEFRRGGIPPEILKGARGY